MKKILGSIIAAAAIWAGSTAIIGNQTKPQLNNYIEKTNNIYASNGIQLKLIEYKKSFLTSSAIIEVDIIDSSLSEVLAESYNIPFKLEYTIEHGPVFLNNGFNVGLSRINSNIQLSSLFKGEDKKDFLALAKDDITIKTEMIVSFLNNAIYTMTSDEVKISDNGNDLHITPLHFNGSNNLTTFKGNGQLFVDTIEFKESNSDNGIKLEHVKMDITIDELIDNMLMLGDIQLSIDNLMVKDDTNPELGDIDIALNVNMKTEKESDKTIHSQFEGTVQLKDTKLPAEIPALKSVHAFVDIKGLGTEGMIAFQKSTQAMQKKQSVLLKDLSSSTPEEMESIFKEFGKLQEEMVGEIIHTLNKLLVKNKTLITYAFDAETKDSKKSKVQASIGYTGEIEFKTPIEELTQKVQQQILDIINLNVDISLDKEHIKSLPNSDELIQQIQMGVAQGFVKETNDTYILNGYYKNKELMVNDNNLTSTVLPFVIMATQGGMQLQ